jgi:uncharacterized membrane protein
MDQLSADAPDTKRDLEQPQRSDPGSDPDQILPPHVEQTVQAIARLHDAHEQRATRLQRTVDRLTALVARPAFVGVVVLTVAGWIAGNLLLLRFAGWSFDRPAFPWLQGVGELAAILITTLILISQRRKDELSELREQLTLELAIMTEQRGAKLIALMEEMRRDDPTLVDRVDSQADEMSNAADPEKVLQAFKGARETAPTGSGQSDP